MKRFIHVILFVPIVCLGDDPFSCVSPEVREAFLPAYPTPFEYSTELPAGFVEHAAPSSSRLVGSQVNSDHANVVYAVDEDIGAAIDELATSIINRGWLDISQPSGMNRRGFQVMPNPVYRQLCHDDGPRTLSISSKDTEPPALVSMSLHMGIGIQSCNDLLDRSRHAYPAMALQEELPILDLPDGIQSTAQGAGGGGDEFETRVAVATEMSKDDLVSVLNDQIQDQGWALDASWSGARSAGSTWVKESAAGKPMIGMLFAYGGSADAYNLRFAIRLDNAAARTKAGFVGTSLRQ